MTSTQTRQGKESWLRGYGNNSKRVYVLGFNRFIEFLNQKDGGSWDDLRLIKEREEDVRSQTFVFERKLLEFFEWLKTSFPNFSDNTVKSYVRAVRSFFSFHRLDIKLTKRQRSTISKRAVPKRKFYEYTLEDIRKMTYVSGPKERYILLAGKELGLKAIDFIKLKQGIFTEHLEEEPPIGLGVIPIEKGAIAMPFLGHDGRQAVERWLTVLKSEGKHDPDDLMLDIGERELSETLKRLTKRAGIHTGKQSVRFRQLRVFLATRLNKVMEADRWIQIIGEKVSEGSYVKPLLREDYRKVLPLITVDSTASLPEMVELTKLKRLIAEQTLKIDSLIQTSEKITQEVDYVKKKISELEYDLEEKKNTNH